MLSIYLVYITHILSICILYAPNKVANQLNALVSRKHMQGICNFSVIEFIYLFNALNFKKKIICICAAYA